LYMSYSLCIILFAPIFSPFFLYCSPDHRDLHSFPTRRSSDLELPRRYTCDQCFMSTRRAHRLQFAGNYHENRYVLVALLEQDIRSEEHTSELQSRFDLVCRLLLEKKKKK